MKKNVFRVSFPAVLLSLALFSIGRASEKTTGVSQSPTLRNFLLEEFTAIHCSYCPSAHAISKNLHAVFGDRMQTIALHVTSLASPGTNELDFRTTYGEEWYSRIGTGGVPSGSINRYRFDGYCGEDSYDINRSLWPQVIRSIMYDTAQVNLYAEATLDTLKRELTVRVEYFYPEFVSDEFHTVTVALTENFIRGTQSGGGAGANYLHQHVLRDLLTDVWGDTVTGLESGKVIEKTFTARIPEQYNNCTPNLSNLEVVAFISNPKEEILNSTSCPVLFPGRYVAPSAEIRVTGISEYYSRTAIPVRIMNLGTDTLRSVKLSVDWGKETYEPEASSLAIPYGHEEEVWFELGEYPFTQVMKYRIATSALNGQDFESNLVSHHAFWPYKVDTDSVRIQVKTTAMGSDLSWTLRARDGEILYRSRPYEEGKVQEETLFFALEDGAVYSLEFEDAFLDGFSGGYSLTDMQGNVIARAEYLGSFGDKVSFMKSENAGNGFAEEALSFAFEAFPNPVSQGGELKLAFSRALSQDAGLRIFDMQGRLMAEYLVRAGSREYSIRIPSWSPGMYLLRLSDGHNGGFLKLVIR